MLIEKNRKVKNKKKKTQTNKQTNKIKIKTGRHSLMMTTPGTSLIHDCYGDVSKDCHNNVFCFFIIII